MPTQTKCWYNELSGLSCAYAPNTVRPRFGARPVAEQQLVEGGPDLGAAVTSGRGKAGQDERIPVACPGTVLGKLLVSSPTPTL